jgi:thiamine biosynthesis lipoprotein ApbE
MSPAAALTAGERDALSWEALGTSAVVRLTDGSAAQRARELAERELDAVDLACSRFRGDSDLSRVNAGAGRPVEVAPLLIEALQVALRAAACTDGDVDPTLGVALILAGYDRDWTLMAGAAVGRGSSSAPRPTVFARAEAGWRSVELDPERRLVRIPRGVRLDLGATAKAWAADRVARLIHEQLGCGALVSLGGDVATAGSPPPGGWRIHVTDDHRAGPRAPGQTVSILSGGLATSSVSARRWVRDGQAMHHIIDPITGAPTRGPWRTVSVAARDCTDANIATTAALVRGRRARAWLTELALPARLVERDGTVHETCGWARASRQPAEGWSGR